eukprot:gene2101-19611_t
MLMMLMMRMLMLLRKEGRKVAEDFVRIEHVARAHAHDPRAPCARAAERRRGMRPRGGAAKRNAPARRSGEEECARAAERRRGMCLRGGAAKRNAPARRSGEEECARRTLPKAMRDGARGAPMAAPAGMHGEQRGGAGTARSHGRARFARVALKYRVFID